MTALAVGIAVMAAAPANAYYVQTYYDAWGRYVGDQAFCDDGTLIYTQGQVTSNYVTWYQSGMPPC